MLGFNLNAQNLEISYEIDISKWLSRNVDSLPKAQQKASKLFNRMIKDELNQTKLKVYTLSADDWFLEIESAMSLDNNTRPSLIVPLLNLHTYIYSSNEEIFGYTNGKDYIVEYDNSNTEWEITSESKQILGFICYKAVPVYFNQQDKRTGTLPTAAWFSPEINFSGGPLLYDDLPGLILEVETSFVSMRADKIDNIDYVKEIPKVDKKIISELQAYKIAKATGAAIEARMKR